MDNDDKPIGRILTRREALTLAASGGLALLVGGRAEHAIAAVQGGQGVDLVATPEIMEGPFFVDDKLKRGNLLADTKRSSVINGIPLKIRVNVYELNHGRGTALAGAHVDLWHCDAIGVYSDEPQEYEDTRGENWLRGYQVTDAKGFAEFDTIFPGWYQGRAIHIHFKVRTYSKSGNVTHDFTSQWFFDEKVNDAVMSQHPYSTRDGERVRNTRDGLYSSRQADGTSVGSHLTMKLQPLEKGYLGTFAVAVNLER